MAINFPDWLEEVDSFTPTENIDTHIFSYDGATGIYLLIRQPFLTETQLINYQNLPSGGAFYCALMFIKNNPPTLASATLYTLRPTFSTLGWLDNWTISNSSATSTEITLYLAGGARNTYEQGYKYTLYRIKKFAD